jgi:hypothetical protein
MGVDVDVWMTEVIALSLFFFYFFFGRWLAKLGEVRPASGMGYRAQQNQQS